MNLLCAGCDALVPADQPGAYSCPRRDELPDVDHVLTVPDPPGPWPVDDDPNPFVRYRTLLASHTVAIARGLDDTSFVDLVRRLDDAVAAVDGHGFVRTPVTEEAALAEAAGLGGVSLVVKDETGNVAGSHKGRHLMGIALHLRVFEATGALATGDLRLAIASCGNAALAASVVAAAGGWPLDVFIPTDADDRIVEALRANGAAITVCARREGERGDPAYLCFREAVGAGAVPFGCQGPDNGLTIDGGRTLGYELAEQAGTLDRLYVQIGGGALASATMQGYEVARSLGVTTAVPALHPVQTEGCAPLARAHEQAGVYPDLHDATQHRSDVMWPWETTPRSAAHGILDDETYDWYRVVASTVTTGGRPVVVPEEMVVEAHRLANAHTTIAVSATGSAGFAGLLADADRPAPGTRVGVLFTGRA